jgi:hypothetical protein
MEILAFMMTCFTFSVFSSSGSRAHAQSLSGYGGAEKISALPEAELFVIPTCREVAQ